TAAEDPAAGPDFYRLVLESDLLVMGAAEGKENAAEVFSLSDGGKLNLITSLKDGAQYLPVFSSLPRMQEFVKQETKFLSIRGRDLLDITRGASVILNPASEYGKELSAQQILQLLDGPGAGIPQYAIEEDYPTALVETLTSVFGTRPDVVSALMVKVGFDDRPGERHPLVGIEMDTSGNWKSLIAAIEEAAQVQVPGLVFDIHRVDRINPIGLTEALLKSRPIYVGAAGASALN
ncbi:MAG: enhanced serine sensitivity protein SseB C-terminal domain-containing protein, partial [Alphaproteobacteria bacterium]|nr:enhanced serine sensitivity protein SseB C-terminal domain-containing protein [Alphaproteobacteria bacterium]